MSIFGEIKKLKKIKTKAALSVVLESKLDKTKAVLSIV